MEEPAEVDVVRPVSESRAHDVEVEPVVDRVHDHVGAVERGLQRSSVAGIDMLRPFEPEVASRHLRPPLLQKAGDLPADGPRCAENDDHGRIVAWRSSSTPRASA